MGILTYEQSRRFYNRFGVKQDRQQFYERPAIESLVEHARFPDAESVYEFGCGTGAFALELLARHLPLTARYCAVDLSETMVEIATRHLSPYAGRASVRQLSGAPATNQPSGLYDRFVANYVLDLLAPNDITSLLSEAYRILSDDGLLCLTSLTFGAKLWSRLVSTIWTNVHCIRPQLLGGCRPLRLLEFVREPPWRVVHRATVTAYGISSEVVIVAKQVLVS